MQTHKDAKIFKSKPLPFHEEMAALFDGTSARGDDKWAPAMDGLPEDITMDMNSSFVNLAHYEDTPSLDPITPRSTI